MKKVFTLLYVALLPLLASAYDAKIDGIYYVLSGDNATVTYANYNYNSYSGTVVIPSTVTYNGKTYSVTSIGNYAFYGCSGLSSITIPNSVTSIGQQAFSGCSSLTSVTIPEGVTSIGGSTFEGCSSLTSVTIGNSVTSIGDYAFYGCSGLSSITIPGNVTSIGSSAFSGCSGLTSIKVESGNSKYDSRNNCNAIIETTTNTLITGCKNTVIPNSVTSIGDYAFRGCSGLTSLTISSGVTSIGKYAFYYCSSLTSVTIPNSVTSIGKYAFYCCISLTSVTIPNSVTSIGDYAFYGCSSLTSVTIPNSVTSIGWYAFRGCSSLTSVTIPNSVTSIGHFAFYGCSSLTSVTIPNSVTSIGGSTFEGCSSLTSVIIPNSVTSIGGSTFEGCSSLTSVTIPNSVTSIGENAFYKTAWYNNQPDGLVYAGKVVYKYKGIMPNGTKITIGEGTLGIAGYAFYNCSGLTSITIPNSVTSIGDEAFRGCSSLTSVTIPEGVTSIGGSTFEGCSSLTSVTIPEGVTSIGDYAFDGCSSLTSVTIPEGVTSIGWYAFRGCSSLTSVTIPNSVTNIGIYAFSGCRGLTSITIPENVTTIAHDAFSGCYFTRDSFINKSQLTYNSNWGAILCDEETNDGLLIEGSNVVKCRFWATTVTIPEGVTRIGDFAFDGCSDLTSVTIPEGVTRIGRQAFHGCISLTSFTIPESVTTIASSAFSGCDGLTSIIIPENVTTIDYSAFFGCYFTRDSFINKSQLTDNSNWGAIICDEITSDGLKIIDNTIIKCRYASTFITIPESVTKVEEFAFSGCTRLKTIVFNDGNSKLYFDTYYKQSNHTPNWFKDCPLDSIYIGRNLDYSFDYNHTCTHSPFKNKITLRSVEFGGYATEIPTECFSECTNLTSVKLSDSIESIGFQAFYYCTGLTSINIGRGVKRISRNAFSNCQSLKSIVIPNNVEEIGSYAFSPLNISSLVIEDGEKDIVMTEMIEGMYCIFEGNTIDSVYWGRNGAVLKYAKIKHLTLGKMKIFEGLGYNYVYGSIGCDTINVLNIKEDPDTLYFSVNQRLNNYWYYYIMPFNDTHIDSIYCNRIIGIYNNYNVSNKHPFDGVDSVVKLELGRKLTSVNDDMFYGCHVQSLYIPNTIKSIASTSFQFCSDLSSVHIEDGPEPLNFGEGNNFYGCPLRRVYLGRDMTYNTNSPFNKNREGINSLEFGNSVTEIPDNAFLGLKNLTELTLASGLKKIGGMAFYGCEGLKSLSIPGSVTEVGQQAFDLCRNLKTLTLEDSSEELTFTAGNNNINNAFANSPLKDIYIGRNFNYSNVSPFLAIDSLQSLTLSNDVTYLKDRAFAGCRGLRKVYSYAEDTPNITSDTFGGIEVSKVLLVVPDDAHEKYKTHPIWKQFWIETPTDNFSSFADKEKLTDIYNFSGQRLPNPQRGINIINGRKVLIR